MSRPAIFLDRDGTLVEPRRYPSRPEELVLYPYLGPELLALKAAGYALVLVTNQSGLARGLFDAAALEAMHAHLRRELRALGAAPDGIRHCPHHPEGSVPALAVACECRKPRPGMLLRAAEELDLRLRDSWFVGDILDDVEAGNRAGCRTVLVDLGTEPPPQNALRSPTYNARDTRHALRLIRAVESLGPRAELAYVPPTFAGAPRLVPPWVVGEVPAPSAASQVGQRPGEDSGSADRSVCPTGRTDTPVCPSRGTHGAGQTRVSVLPDATPLSGADIPVCHGRPSPDPSTAGSAPPPGNAR